MSNIYSKTFKNLLPISSKQSRLCINYLNKVLIDKSVNYLSAKGNPVLNPSMSYHISNSYIVGVLKGSMT